MSGWWPGEEGIRSLSSRECEGRLDTWMAVIRDRYSLALSGVTTPCTYFALSLHCSLTLDELLSPPGLFLPL